jgi:hypothetical protein
MRQVSFGLLLALALVAVFPVLASRSARSDSDEVIFRTPPAGLSLFDTVQWIGAEIEGSVTFAPPALRIAKRPDARVVVSEPVKLARERVLGFGQDLLAAHGLVLFDVGRPGQPLWLVESTGEPTVLAGRAAFVSPDDLARYRWVRTPITTAVELRVAPLGRVRSEVLEAVAGNLPAGAAVIPVPATNGFILRGPGRDVFAWNQLIARLDRTPPPGTEPPPSERDAMRKRLENVERRLDALEAGEKRGPDKRGERDPGDG